MSTVTRREFLCVSGGLALSARARQRSATATYQTLPSGMWINHDPHTHTLYSAGAHPIPLHILKARALELDALAITRIGSIPNEVGTSARS